jgi:anti-anti-sigma factor
VNLVTDLVGLRELPRGSHVCWLVDDATDYCAVATAILDDGRRLGEKPLVFGPADSADFRELAPTVALAADPYVAFLGEGALVPDLMFAMFREQAELARGEGYQGLRLVADMDWLRPTHPGTADIVGFEVLLDRLVAELGATVVCAYRSSSLGAEALAGALTVHPLLAGVEGEPQLRFVWNGTATWRVAGEVDLAVRTAFTAALNAVVGDRSCDLDVTDLEFVDVAGLRAIVDAARTARAQLRLRGASPILRRSWQLGGFDEAAPTVRLTAAAG